MFTTGFARSARVDDDAGTPIGINLAVGAVTITVAVFLAASVPSTDPQWRCVVVAMALGLFAAFSLDRLAVAAIVLPTWMIMNGFLVNHLGDLSWHGRADLARFVVLVAAGLLGLVAGEVRLRLRSLRDRWQWAGVVQQMRTEINEETKHRA